MARIRTIKPEFPQSESMGRVSREARLCFVLLWTIADDSGRLRGNSRMLASLLYPYDDDAPKLIEGWLIELEREHCIRRYEIDGDRYLAVCAWEKHQKIDKPTASKIDPPPANSETPRESVEKIREDSRESREDSTTDQGRDQGEEGKRAKRSPSVDTVPVSELVDAGFEEQTALDFIAHKAKAKAPLTRRAWADHQREASKAGWTVQAAAEKVMAKSWKGFEASYVAGKGGAPPQALADSLGRFQ